MEAPYIIGVAGGSGSGKTFFARELQKILGDAQCTILYQDNYYIDQSHRFDGDGGSVNFDHPESLDFALLAKDLSALKKGKSIKVPIYDFATHTRKKETLDCHPKKIILVDGILILDSALVREELDEAIFFDTPEELRFKRRLERDVHERGRTAEGVKKQFDLQVKPMHNQFVEPSKSYAQTIVKDFGDYHEAIEFFTKKLT
ncbi:uridine kinase [Bacteriovorax sp. PP10]|uniref:uridine/cytidine kinase n=1 Tax=Bacteriovorax antarcticus TaxID=3088717 RepID=A0ABU5VQ01_9BACT|nr:uridine kinase [Bacteriovorax sp. PP10]MEA9355120.1 uridine kinase [Bacteriovorax sp. PP10]